VPGRAGSVHRGCRGPPRDGALRWHDLPVTTGMGLRAQAAARLGVMVDRLRELVEVESPSSDVQALERCAGLLDDWFSPVFPSPARRPVAGLPHLLWSGPDPEVLLLGHFDTVWPAGTLAGWPFTVTDGVASGPGVFDMKAGIIQLLVAVGLCGRPDRVSVLLTCDEETGSATSRAVIEAEALRAGAVLVCEPSADGGAVKTARKGTATYRVAVAGRAAHAGLEPELGVNAAVELARQILALSGLADPAVGTSVTPTVVAGGTTTNTVPEAATVHLDVRAWTAAELDRVDAAVRATRPHHSEAAITVTGGINRYPLQPQPGLDLLAVLADAAAGLGLPAPDGVGSGGGSDGNLTAAVGIPTLDGLGAVGAHPHGRDEHVDVNAMPDRAALLAALLNRLTGA
jgi:glutamate carboxypeptidase